MDIRNHSKLLLLVICTWLLMGNSAESATFPDKLWSVASPQLQRKIKGDAERGLMAAENVNARQFVPSDFQLFELDIEALDQLIAKASRPDDLEVLDNTQPIVTIPMPDGTLLRFQLIESPVMSPALQAKFPEIKSFRGQCLDNRQYSMRMDVAPRDGGKGFHAQVLGPKGAVIVDPVGEGNLHMSFDKRANRVREAVQRRCLLENKAEAGFNRFRQERANSQRLPIGGQLRTFRLAVACTGEYAQFHGGTVAGAMAAINTTINRLNSVYEQEVAIRFQLVDNNDQLIFLDPTTDPFNNFNATVLVNQSQAQIDGIIGDANYDIGHTFSTGAGGYAPGPVGVSGEKAMGVTGQSSPHGDPFDIDYVAHEIGHQFNGGHTFNGTGCNPNARFAPTAVEPGSGSTILAYAGICGTDDLQVNSHPYFHSVTLEQITDYATSIANVGTETPTGNNPPVVDAGESFTIPR